MRGLTSRTRVELIKLTFTLPFQLLVLLVIAAPIAFAALLSGQSGTPSDALLGNWSHSSGVALSLVLLSFAGNWGAPIIAGILAGDLFAAEDRHRTWKTILGRGTSLGELVSAKCLAVGLLGLLLGAALALSSLFGGVIFVGAHPMVDLSGRLLSAGHVFGLALLAWLATLPGLLAFIAVAALASALSANVIVGVLAPVLLGLANQLLSLTGNGTWLHLLLISGAFTSWPGLFTRHVFLGPLLFSELACLVWIAACLTVLWAVLRRREFVPAEAGEESEGRARRLLAPARAVAAVAVVLALAALATTLGPVGVTRTRVSGALAASFRSLTLLQQDQLGHPIPAGAKYTILPLCNKRGARPVGPGDWDCTVNVYVLLPGGDQPLTDTPVDYDVSVAANGCLKADAPAQIVGGATIRVHGTRRRVINPLNVIHSCFNVL